MQSSLGVAILSRLIAARRKAKLTQKQVGDRLSQPVTAQTVSHWEHGRGSPNLREIGELCTLYGTSTDWVLRGIATKPDTGSVLVDRVLGAEPANLPKDFADSEK